MTFQTKVNEYLAVGVVGEYADASPRREAGYILLSNTVDDVEYLPTIACAFTVSTDTEGAAQVGGSGVFAGVLVNPKQFANYQGLNATLELPSGLQGGLCTFGHVYVQPATAYEIGYVAAFNTTTGAINAYATSDDVETGYTLIENAKFIKYSGEADTIAVLELG